MRQSESCLPFSVPPPQSPVLAFAVAALVIAASFGSARAGWTDQTVDGSAPNGSAVSLAVQGPGRVHLVYQNTAMNELDYASSVYGMSPWTIQKAYGPEENVGSASAIAVGSDGAVRVSYYGQYNHETGYTTDLSGTWQSQSLVTGQGYAGTAVTVDDNDHTYVAGTDGALYLATDTAGTLVKTTVLDGSDTAIPADGVSAVLVSPAGIVSIVYTSGANVCVASNESGYYTSRTIGTMSIDCHTAAVTLDADGYVHAAYVDLFNNMKYATNASGAWQSTFVGSTLTDFDGFSIAISATDGASGVTIAFYDPGSKSVKVATDGSDWQFQSLYALPAAPKASADTCLALDSAGSAYLAYFDTAGNLHLATDDTSGPHGADVAVTQTVSPTPVLAGDDATFTVTVTNNGPEEATGVSLVDEIPADATFVSASASAGTFTQDAAAGTMTWTVDTLTAEQSEQLTLVLTMPGSGTVSNTATVSSDAGPDPADPSDFRQGNNVAASSVALEEPVQHQLFLAITDDAGGTLSVDNGQVYQNEGAIVPVTASPDPGYRVKQWQGTMNDDSTANTNAVQIGRTDQTVRVTFEKIPQSYVLSAAVAGGIGTILPTGGTYESGTIVTLTAKPDRHYRVKKWTGTNDDTSTNSVNAVTMNDDHAVTVTFESKPNEAPVATYKIVDEKHFFMPGETVTLDASDTTIPKAVP